ncbi:MULTISPECIES: hypothetical protein [unclassified Actinotalea]|uniref:hypothetical protein n=1 Tax=unclassified Actinotalea TaxID=2638618 RepID=UPI0015F4AA99|nr:MULTISPECIES: hypothetical protein [unclassified Actinotalea]
MEPTDQAVLTAERPVLARPVATRLRRPGWRDPRLLLGLVLVALSVALGAWAVGAAGRTVPVYVAQQALVPGQVLDASVLVVRDVRLDAAAGAYLGAGEPLPDDLVVQRPVAQGELVPRGALAQEDDLGLRPVAVGVPAGLPSGLAPGAAVDLWFVPAAADGLDASGAGEATEPYEVAAGLTVAEVAEPEGAFSVGATTTVHVLVPVDRLSEVLAVTAAEGSLHVVVVPGLGTS